MARYEQKYVINEREFVRLERRLALVLNKDVHCLAGPYLVRSLYYDTVYNDVAHDGLAGLLNKQKIRLRTYDLHHGPYTLEYKCKTGDLGVKKSVHVSREEAEQLVVSRYDCLKDRHDEVAVELYARMMGECWVPASIVDYHRCAYVHPTFDTRITFDFRVGGSLDTRGFFEENVPLTPLMRPGVGVLEVKYNGVLMSVVEEIIQDVDAITQANSKYLQSRLWSL